MEDFEIIDEPDRSFKDFEIIDDGPALDLTSEQKAFCEGYAWAWDHGPDSFLDTSNPYIKGSSAFHGFRRGWNRGIAEEKDCA